MNYRLRTLQILIALVFGALLCLHFWDFIWTQSVDLAHHYVLVTRLTEFGDLPFATDPSLGEMRVYPRLSHRFAAGLGRLWGSPLAGMQIVVLVSMVVLWAAIGWMLWSQPSRQARRSTLNILLALFIGGYLLRLDLWGREIVGNYFYAQFVAQAAALLALAIVLTLAQAGWSRFVVYGLLIAGIFGIELIHLLPAVELLGFLGLLVVFDQLWQSRRWAVRGLAASAAFLVAALLAVVANPVFKAMASISENDGVLRLTFIPNHFALLALVLATAISSVFGIWYWLRLKDPVRQRELLAIKYFALLGLSISTLCLLQMAALEIGRGSEYACRKYAFGLWTVLLVNVSLLLARGARPKDESKSGLQVTTRIFDCSAVGLLVVVAAFATFPGRKYLSLQDLMSTERRLESVKASAPAIPEGTSAYAIQLPGEPPLIDYLFSLGVFKSARSANTINILQNQDLTLSTRIGLIVTAKDKSRYDLPECRLHSTDPVFALIDGTCYVKTFPERKFCRGEMHLTDSELTQGFSSPEEQGSWTDGKESAFHCQMPDHATDYPESVRISGFAFVPGSHIQHVSVSVNGAEAKEFVFDSLKPDTSIVVAVPKGGGSTIQIKFFLPNAVSPSEMGLSPDSRKLGFYVKSIQLLKGDGQPI
ncbi:hypothetical protein [Paraburkholderia hiiakae]|nr:hypothetical protein [Paraburkholderia hiiakae]